MERQPIDFLMLKPLGAQEPLKSEILDILQSVAVIVAVKRKVITLDEACKQYGPSGHDLKGKPLPHFHAITRYLAGKTVETMIAMGKGDPEDFIASVDNIIGPWQPQITKKGQIRNLLLSNNIQYVMPVVTPEGSNDTCFDNLIHSSDSYEAAIREMSIHFTEDELKDIFIKK